MIFNFFLQNFKHEIEIPYQKRTSQDTNIQLTKKVLYANNQPYGDRHVPSRKDRAVTRLIAVPLAPEEVRGALGHGYYRHKYDSSLGIV